MTVNRRARSSVPARGGHSPGRRQRALARPVPWPSLRIRTPRWARAAGPFKAIFGCGW